MASLKIKHLPEALYRKLQQRARLQHRSLAQEVINILSEALDTPERLSLLELRGFGKEQWEGIDGAEHVDSERDSWE
jgi:plasmid stability protein